MLESPIITRGWVIWEIFQVLNLSLVWGCFVVEETSWTCGVGLGLDLFGSDADFVSESISKRGGVIW